VFLMLSVTIIFTF